MLDTFRHFDGKVAGGWVGQTSAAARPVDVLARVCARACQREWKQQYIHNTYLVRVLGVLYDITSGFSGPTTPYGPRYVRVMRVWLTLDTPIISIQLYIVCVAV